MFKLYFIFIDSKIVRLVVILYNKGKMKGVKNKFVYFDFKNDVNCDEFKYDEEILCELLKMEYGVKVVKYRDVMYILENNILRLIILKGFNGVFMFFLLGIKEGE